MERRPHPNHDWKTLRTAAPLVLIAWGGVGFWALQLGWLAYIGVGVFLAATALLVIVAVRGSNQCKCPDCGLVLVRDPNTTEFRCEQCRVVWYTQTWSGPA